MELRSKRGRPPDLAAPATPEPPHARARTRAPTAEHTGPTTRSRSRAQTAELPEPPRTRARTRADTTQATAAVETIRPVTRSQTRARAERPADHVVAGRPAARTPVLYQQRAVGVLRQHLRRAAAVVRALIFVQIPDEMVCLRIRSFFLSRTWTVALLGLIKVARGQPLSLQESLVALADAAPTSIRDNLDEDRVVDLLSTILAHVLLGEVDDFRPLVDKLSGAAARRMDWVFGDRYEDAIRHCMLQEPVDKDSWFSTRYGSPATSIDQSLVNMRGFRHVRDWAPDRTAHQARFDAFHNKEATAHELLTLNAEQRRLNSSRRTCMQQGTWTARSERAHERSIAEIAAQKKPLMKQKSRLLLRTKKYRLLPTREQQHTLRKFMGTCRWTYNQGVAHFHATNNSNANTLTTLYATENTATGRVYPEGMGPPPDWASQTPQSMRNNAMRALAANVRTAFKQLHSGLIRSFHMHFSSRKRSPGFTFTEDAKRVSLRQHDLTRGGKPAMYLSLTSLKDIRIRMANPAAIGGEVDISYENGFWYASIPHYVEPELYESDGSCIALDPGIKTFLTGVDLNGNVVEFARGNQRRLNAVRGRQAAAQSVIDKFKHKKKMRGRAWRWEYRKYAKAKRTFHSCTAKLKHLVKDLHYKACCYLTDRYDTILLPRFQTQSFVRRSSARNHGFNRCILSLNHYQFRQMIAAKCAVKGNTLIECSEMYTSQTCGGCNRLHTSLGSNDFFVCPHDDCDFRAGRDVNAAMNILRFTIAGSLQVFSRTTAGRH